MDLSGDFALAEKLDKEERERDWEIKRQLIEDKEYAQKISRENEDAGFEEIRILTRGNLIDRFKPCFTFEFITDTAS